MNIDNEIVVDNSERLDKIDRDMKLNEIRMKEIENHITEMSTNNEDRVRMLSMEKEIKQLKDNMKNKHNKK